MKQWSPSVMSLDFARAPRDNLLISSLYRTEGMRNRIIVYLLVLLTIVSVVVPFTLPLTFHKVAPAVQDNRHEGLILAQAAEAIHNAEPEWQYTPGICNCLGLKREQHLGVAIGALNRSLSGSSDDIIVGVSRFATAGAAAMLIYRERYGNHRKGLSVTSYKLGDGANMATYLATYRGVTQYRLTVWKGRFLAGISGRSKEAVERFAPFFVTELSK